METTERQRSEKGDRPGLEVRPRKIGGGFEAPLRGARIVSGSISKLFSGNFDPREREVGVPPLSADAIAPAKTIPQTMERKGGGTNSRGEGPSLTGTPKITADLEMSGSSHLITIFSLHLQRCLFIRRDPKAENSQFASELSRTCEDKPVMTIDDRKRHHHHNEPEFGWVRKKERRKLEDDTTRLSDAAETSDPEDDSEDEEAGNTIDVEEEEMPRLDISDLVAKWTEATDVSTVDQVDLEVVNAETPASIGSSFSH
ncbi:hypothetical protein DL766_010400 [Monosporascus sp. MC13-8B]|uniref:Uncharacterized protein n=1 Tax=Monosporascus cannonballus TaxID=155416 RepID=A0ABY0HBW3_9PEZI|nr:hypothetical protein DL762_002954 [Monosporascus cannonballus]RYO96605.1 hypothetical protein DL763_003091 [Monosporascus cannonballus]RYP02363.1 hypothetical protein DL766_010400 [Monosporascus sp. MC13-8B]